MFLLKLCSMPLLRSSTKYSVLVRKLFQCQNCFHLSRKKLPSCSGVSTNFGFSGRNCLKRIVEGPKRCLFTSERRLLPPWLLLLYKFKFMKVLKGASVLVGRSGRKFYPKLPVKVQNQISRHKIVASCSLAVLIIILYYSYKHYDVCPLTGRRRWISFTRDQILILAEMDHKRLLESYQNKLFSKDTQLYQVCNNLIKTLVDQNSDLDVVKHINWNLNIVDDNEMTNAFVLPNGEIYLFTGMIQLMNDWEELAIVLSHEMAHTILGHVQEQQSFVMFGELLIIPVLAFLWFLLEDFSAFIVLAIENYLFPLIFEVGFNLPYSRQLEMEADIVGLDMATKACFDPRWAVLLWDKMALKEAVDSFVKGEKTNIDFLSSHPSHDERATILEGKLDQMLVTRSECGCPKLPSLNPLASAHLLRLFSANIRKRFHIIEELNLIAAHKDKGPTETDSKTCGRLEKELASLTSEYEAMLKKENVKFFLSSKSQAPSTFANHQAVVRIWSDVIGDQLKVDFQPGLSEIETKNSIDNSEKAMHSLHQSPKRNYYNSI